MHTEATTWIADVGTPAYTGWHVVAVLEGTVPTMTAAQFCVLGVEGSTWSVVKQLYR